MSTNTPSRRLPVLALGFAMIVAACASESDDTGPSASGEPVAATATTAPATTTPSTAPTTTAPAPTTTIASPDPLPLAPPDGMELVWSDEFDGDSIDLTNWTYDIGGWGWGNGEAQYYTDRPENARVQNGLLVIELRQEKFDDSYYTSARLKTQGLREFQYGRLEARIKVPRGAGTWPAFWMLGADFEQDSPDPAKQWPAIGEIDIMEYTGKEPDLILGTVHGPGYAGAGGKSKWFQQEFAIADDWHTYAIDWNAERIQWFFDDELYFELGPENVGNREWVFDQPFFFILNLALGGTLGGNIALDLEFPIQYYVDHVRVYQPVAGSGA
jgi:beta-glucanase (GH16 family)